MHLLFSFITSLTITITAVAQSNTYFPFFSNIKGDRKVLADTALLYVAPSNGAAIADTVYVGNDINVMMQVPFNGQKNNIQFPWLKIAYKKKGFTKIAFIPAIDVSLSTKLLLKDVEVVWGMVNNNKKDSLVSNEMIEVNNYTAKIVTLKKQIKLAEHFFYVPNQMHTDSVLGTSIKKINLKNTLGNVQIEMSNTKINNFSYQFNFIVCNKGKIAALEVINSYQSRSQQLRPTTSYYSFGSHKIVYSVSGFMDGDKVVETYKWKDCSVIKEW